MYQRLAILSSLRFQSVAPSRRGRQVGDPEPTLASRSAPQLQNRLHTPGDDGVCEQEEDGRHGHHDEHHRGGDPDLFVGRPRHLRYFLTHLFDEVEGILHNEAHNPLAPHTCAALIQSRPQDCQIGVFSDPAGLHPCGFCLLVSAHGRRDPCPSRCLFRRPAIAAVR